MSHVCAIMAKKLWGMMASICGGTKWIHQVDTSGSEIKNHWKKGQNPLDFQNNWSMKSMKHVCQKSSMHSGSNKKGNHLKKNFRNHGPHHPTSCRWHGDHEMPDTDLAKWICLQSVNWRKHPDLHQIKARQKYVNDPKKTYVYIRIYIYILMTQ